MEGQGWTCDLNAGKGPTRRPRHTSQTETQPATIPTFEYRDILSGQSKLQKCEKIAGAYITFAAGRRGPPPWGCIVM
jgi:hypothetical protein